MREIKFRAWDSYNGKMLDNHEPLVWNSVMPMASHMGSEPKNFIVMQFTGLTDCNGVKIFEGDVLSVMVQELSDKLPKTGIKELDEYKPKKGEKFHTGKKIHAIWTIEHVNHLTYTGFKFYGLNRRFNKMATRSMIYNNQVKVIGNIHQNPELLERTNANYN